MAPSQEQVTDEHGSPISDATVYVMQIGLGVKATAIPQMERTLKGTTFWRLPYAGYAVSPYASSNHARAAAVPAAAFTKIFPLIALLNLAGSQIETSIDGRQIAQSETYRSSGWQLRHRK